MKILQRWRRGLIRRYVRKKLFILLWFFHFLLMIYLKFVQSPDTEEDAKEDATLTPAMKEYLKKRSAAAAAAASASTTSTSGDTRRNPDNDPSLFSL